MTNGIPLCMDGLSAGVNKSQAPAFGNRTGSSDVHVFPDSHVIMQKYAQMPPLAPCSFPAAAVTVVHTGCSGCRYVVDVLCCTILSILGPKNVECLSLGVDVLLGVLSFKAQELRSHWMF